MSKKKKRPQIKKGHGVNDYIVKLPPKEKNERKPDKKK